MKLKKVLSLVSCCALFVGSEVNPINSIEIFKTVKKTANSCFRAVRYTGNNVDGCVRRVGSDEL